MRHRQVSVSRLKYNTSNTLYEPLYAIERAVYECLPIGTVCVIGNMKCNAGAKSFCFVGIQIDDLPFSYIENNGMVPERKHTCR